MPASMGDNLGSELVASGLITQDQLTRAEASQKTLGGNIAQILLKKGFLKEDAIYSFYQEKMGLEKIELSGRILDRSLLRFAPFPTAKKYCLIPLSFERGVLSIVVADPFHLAQIEEELSCEGYPLKFVLAPRPQIEGAIRNNYSVHKVSQAREVEIVQGQSKAPSKQPQKFKELASSMGALETVNSILQHAYEDKASDIHIEPMENYVRVRFRVDGVLEERHLLANKLLLPLVSRIKILSGMNIAERRAPQDGRFTAKIHGQVLDCRSSTYPTVQGEKIVIRLLSKKALIKLEQLGMVESDREKFRSCVLKPHGLLLVTGPTGSGKSTTLYAGLQLLNSVDRNILSIEDPVENDIPGVNQGQLNNKANMTFASAMRSMLRQDPDVIMVGEIRDSETAEMAIRAALTGHLVLSTLHTNTAMGAVTRLANLGVPPFLVASSLVGVLGQRLVRRICSQCKAPQPEAEREDPRLIDLEPYATLYHGAGCEACRHTGFEGRMGLYDMVVIDRHLRKLIEEEAKEEVLIEEARKHGWKSMLEDGKEKVLKGMTNVREVLKVTELD